MFLPFYIAVCARPDHGGQETGGNKSRPCIGIQAVCRQANVGEGFHPLTPNTTLSVNGGAGFTPARGMG